MAQHGFQMGGHGGNGIDPNDLSIATGYPSSFANNDYGSNDPSGAFQPGAATFNDDELLDGLHQDQSGLPTHGNFGGLNGISAGFPPAAIYSRSHHGLQVDPSHNVYSRTPDGEPIQSPFVQGNFGHYPTMGHHSFGTSLQSPQPYGSPLAGVDEAPEEFMSNGRRPRLQQTARPQPVSARASLTPNNQGLAGLSINSDSAFAQPIRAGGGHHEKSHSGQWMHTPNSLQSLPGSNLSSPPVQAGFMAGPPGMQSMMKGGTSMPTKLHMPSQVSSQEAKKRRRRESHNLVERRRRDNINERIQDLSKMVPPHRLEDDKLRKAIQSGALDAYTAAAAAAAAAATVSSPNQATPGPATSGLGPLGAKRAVGAGNITTGLPLDDKDKGPNKGDILNGAVSWMRDLMWMLSVKLQQQEEMVNALHECGSSVPFEITDDERRMQTELMELLNQTDDGGYTSYSRTHGSGLRVPQHTNFNGDALTDGLVAKSGQSGGLYTTTSNDGQTPGNATEMQDDDFVDYKDEDDYGMDMTQ
ncbi:HLH transcription factor [Podospora conica]|nr:HLH transcription factor [Schizothecium conicum]